MFESDGPTDEHCATAVYHRLESLLADVRNQLTLGYTRESDIDGAPGNHRFVLHGWCHDAALFTELADIIDEYQPDEVSFGNGVKGHIALSFAPERLTNTPPEPDTSYRSVGLGEPKQRTVTECHNCRGRVDPAIPSLTLVYASDTPHAEPETDTVSFCTACSPAHFDDVARHWESFGVTDGAVTHLLRPSWTEYEDDNITVKAEHSAEWVAVADLDDMHGTAYAIRAIERHLAD